MSASDFLDFMPDTVTIEPFSSMDGYGKATYGAAVSVRCRVEQGAKNVKDFSGQEAVSMTQLYLSRTSAVGLKDRITLPAGSVPLRPPIINSVLVKDEAGAHHVEVYL